ncbi:hypothetical protein HZC34_04110 [Candidatus Saganbacteria bacterium]|nr:hypothetical protein [Candidatus Saganbacteria bacterium]
MRHEEYPKISCPIFKRQETAIKDITDKINTAKGIKGKAALAEELEKEIEVLLSCPDYDGEKLDCRNCEFIASLRKQTAALIRHARKLS